MCTPVSTSARISTALASFRLRDASVFIMSWMPAGKNDSFELEQRGLGLAVRQLPENKIPDLRNRRWDQDRVFREMLITFQPLLDCLESPFC
jgi:hypothetical protein